MGISSMNEELNPKDIPVEFLVSPWEKEQEKKKLRIFFWSFLGGMFLLMGGMLLAIFLGVNAVKSNVDISRNSETGLPDGNYLLIPTGGMARTDGKCAFTGEVQIADQPTILPGVKTIVGENDDQCGPITIEPKQIRFVVSNGTASITELIVYTNQ